LSIKPATGLRADGCDKLAFGAVLGQQVADSIRAEGSDALLSGFRNRLASCRTARSGFIRAPTRQASHPLAFCRFYDQRTRGRILLGSMFALNGRIVSIIAASTSSVMKWGCNPNSSRPECLAL
jgi:hypothetical protein